MKKLYIFLVVCFLGLGLKAQNARDLVGNYHLETAGLNGSLKISYSVDPDQNEHLTLVFQGAGTESATAFLADDIVDGKFMVKDLKTGGVMEFENMVVRMVADQTVPTVQILTSDGLEYLFRKQ